jgi:hypothetical protein
VYADRTLESASNGEAPPVIEDDEEAVAASHELADLVAGDGVGSVDLHDSDRGQALQDNSERFSECKLAQPGDDSCGLALCVSGDNVPSIEDRRARAPTKRHSVAVEHADGR